MMRMKNRYCRMGNSLLGAMCLLSTCGVMYSCTDDYDLDETKPNFLKESIYDELKANGNFTNVVRLIDDLEYADVLSRTGSKTLFVADDAAYERFYQNNSWGVTSYGDLTAAQKRYLLNGSMLNNAYVMEMLVNTSGGSEGKNLCLRQVSAATALDTIPYWRWDQLPENLNQMDESGNPIPEENIGEDETTDLKFWKKFRDRKAGGIYMALDKTQPMLTHFLEGQLNEKNITKDDVAFILNKDESWTENRSYIYGNRVLTQDVTCLNGYYHILDEVLLTPPNMAEVLRQNGTDGAYNKDKNTSTKYFSLLLERFSAPYYDANLTQQYKALYEIDADSIYQKRYLSNNSQGGKIAADPDNNPLGDFPYLNFDPGWNELTSSTTTPKEQDMSAIFAPSDAAMEHYFLSAGGQNLMDRYAKLPNTQENLAYNLYQVPLDIVQALLRNLMKESFNESVPSKYLTIMNDAQDQMFPKSTYASMEAFKQSIQKCLLANNGVIYIMDGVTAPADYASVIAPALYSKGTQVVKTVVRADDGFIDGNAYDNAPLKMYFSTYLKAMQSRFSFFVPTDAALKEYGYVDPFSYGQNTTGLNKNRRTMKFAYDPVDVNPNNKEIAVKMEGYLLNEFDGTLDTPDEPIDKVESAGKQPVTSGWGQMKKNLLIEMIDHHIVLHDKNEDINSGRNFYMSRGGAPVFVSKRSNDRLGIGMEVKGGYQLMLDADEAPENDHVCTVVEGYDQTAETNNNYGNGMTYFIDRPIQSSMKTVYNRMTANDNFKRFRDLCMAFDDKGETVEVDDLLEAAGLKLEDMDNTEWNNEINKYTIFSSTGVNPPQNEYLVRFFNNYRYTIYVPSNDAVEKAINDKGLPTWGTIQTFVEDNKGLLCSECSSDDEVEKTHLCPHNQQKAQAMLTTLISFLKYHFQDESLFVDNVTEEMSYQTSCIDNEANVYLPLLVEQNPGTMTVTDRGGNVYNVASDPALHNILSRELNFDMKPIGIKNTSSYGSVKVSSYVTLHQLDGALDFRETGGRYDKAWNTAASAKSFVKKYRPRK